jgi:hypothetical protein
VEVVTDENGEEGAWVGSGNRWKDVYAKLEPLNITVIGARDREVGVGGFVLGGKLDYTEKKRVLTVWLTRGYLNHVTQAWLGL